MAACAFESQDVPRNGEGVEHFLQGGLNHAKRKLEGESKHMNKESMAKKHETGTREQWLAARLDLLKAEKELTRQGDALARRRQELPWVRVEKNYQFETEEGKVALADLFRGRSQLLVYHFMFGP